MGLAARLAHEKRVAVLFTEHDMDIVFSHADRIIVLSRGELIAEGKAEEIRRNPLVLKTYLGEGQVYGQDQGSKD
jgi:branched-chain amino acid transport system ATP-binding protein